MEENPNHKELKDLAKAIFEAQGYGVQVEQEFQELDLAGKHPDLLLDDKIPVEVGNVGISYEPTEKKIDEYLAECERVFWIPYPTVLSPIRVIEFVRSYRKVDYRPESEERMYEQQKK